MSEDTRTIHERMVAILADLPPIGKDQKNTQQGFMFRGHDDVLNALNPMLAKHGVFVIPHVLGRETSERTTAKGSVMFEVSLLVEFTFYGLTGDFVRGSAWGEGTDMGDKATSKAMTMAFKSMLNPAFAISSKEMADPDSHTPEDTTGRSSAAPKPASPKAGNSTASPAAGTDTPTSVPAAPSADQLNQLYELVKVAGGDVAKTMTGAQTAEERGLLAKWYVTAHAFWAEKAAPILAEENKPGFEIPLSPADKKRAAA